MVNNKYFCYFVEGDNEKKIVNELKGKYLESGVINKFNILQETISNHILRKFSRQKKEYLYHSLWLWCIWKYRNKYWEVREEVKREYKNFKFYISDSNYRTK